MYTRLKPQRVKTSNTPQPGQGLGYIDPENFEWENITGDMQYADFQWHTLTGDTITIENIANNYTPTGNFTVSAGTVKPGIEYYLRVNVGNNPYLMILGTGVTNPNGYDTNLKENTIHLFKFIATSTSQLEFEGVDTSNFVTLNTVQSIIALKQFTIEPTLPSKSTAAGNNPTKPATEAQVYLKADDDKVVHKAGAETITGEKTFQTEPVLPSKSTAAGNNPTKPATEAQVYPKANDSDVVHNTGAETISGVKTFQDKPIVPTPTSDSHAANKKYVDDNIAAATQGAVSDAAYGSSWDGVTGIAPSKNAVYDKISSMDTAIGTNTTNIGTNTSDIATINGKIPAEATTTNQLADKQYVLNNINSVAAYYITKDAQGNQFATYAQLAAATTFYSGGVVRVPTMNDYTIVLDDENHDHATTRYIYNNGWEYQYTINETALTQAQLDALNSGITAAKVTIYDGYANDLNVKLFSISGTSDTTNAQAALDWYNAGKCPVLKYNSNFYYPRKMSTSSVELCFFPIFTTDGISIDNTHGYSILEIEYIALVHNGTTSVASITIGDRANTSHAFLSPLVSYTNVFTPTQNGHPATKKYVDDNVVQKGSTAPSNPADGTIWYNTSTKALKVYNSSTQQWTDIGAVTSVNGSTGAVTVNEVPSTGNVGDVLTKTSNGYAFQTPAASGIICDPNSPIQIEKLRCGTEAQYTSATKEERTAYLTV